MEYPRRELAQGDSSKIFEIYAPTDITFNNEYTAKIVVKDKLGTEIIPILEKDMIVEEKKIYGALEPDDTTQLPVGNIYITIQVVNLARFPKFTREKTYLFTVYPQGA